MTRRGWLRLMAAGVLVVWHPIHLEGVGIDVFPFAVCDAGFYLEVFLEFNEIGRASCRERV